MLRRQEPRLSNRRSKAREPIPTATARWSILSVINATIAVSERLLRSANGTHRRQVVFKYHVYEQWQVVVAGHLLLQSDLAGADPLDSRYRLTAWFGVADQLIGLVKHDQTPTIRRFVDEHVASTIALARCHEIATSIPTTIGPDMIDRTVQFSDGSTADLLELADSVVEAWTAFGLPVGGDLS